MNHHSMDAQGVDWQQFCLRGVASATEDGGLRAQVIFVGPGHTVSPRGIHIFWLPSLCLRLSPFRSSKKNPTHVRSLLSLKLQAPKQGHIV